MVALEGDGGIDSAGVDLQVVKLFFWDGGYGTICGGAKLKEALDAVMFEQRRSEYLCEIASGVASKKIHLEEAILCRDEALCEDEILQRSGTNVRDTVAIALYGDRCSKSGNGESTIGLGQGGFQNMLYIRAGGKERSQPEDEQDRDGDCEISGKAARRAGRGATLAALD